MKKFLGILRNYFCYCGIKKEEYVPLRKNIYLSNFKLWRIIFILMSAAFTFLFVNSLINQLLRSNLFFYLGSMVYSIALACLFLFVLKNDSLIAQILIYLTILMLFAFGCFVTQNKPYVPATTFFVFLLICPMFVLGKPYYMIIELLIASAAFCVWMYFAKADYYDIWLMDFVNVLIYLPIGIFIHIIANSIRIKEFVLTRKINIQKDLDDLTGLKNKSAVTREINEYLNNENNNKGIMILLDIDNFKNINDTYGHDVGDIVLSELGKFLKNKFRKNNEIVGRFGGDEFFIFIKDIDDMEFAKNVAIEVIDGASNFVTYSNQKQPISVSLGIAIYHGLEKNYSEIFKKADIALYKTKADRLGNYSFY